MTLEETAQDIVQQLARIDCLQIERRLAARREPQNAIGEKAIELDPSLVYVALLSKGQAIRVIVFAGEVARKKVKAGTVAKKVSATLGGSGGGNERFGQGGGKSKDRIKEALQLAEKSAEG